MAKSLPRIYRRAIAQTERRSVVAGSSGPWGGPVMGMSSFLPAPVMSGIAVTPETSLTLVPVFTAINVIATDTASLPLRTLRTLRSGGHNRVPAHPTYNLVYLEPNDYTTSMGFRQALMGHRLLWGNGYAEIERSNGGTPIALHLLSPKPGDTWPERHPGGRLVYRVDAGRRTLLPENVIHVAGLGWDGLTGYSPIALARQAVGLGIATEQFGAAFFGNGCTEKGVLEFPGKLTPEAIRNLRESVEGVHQGTVNAHRLMILEQGMKFTRNSIPPEDAQFLETRKFQVIEIARLYRLPPHKLGDYSQSHLSNIEAANIDYLNTTLAPELERIEQELNRKLFTARERAHGLHVAHDLTALFRGDMKARADYYTKRFLMGSISPDEIREREGDNPLPDGLGSQTYRQMQLVPLGSEPKPEASPTAATPPSDSIPGLDSTNVETPSDEGGDGADSDESSPPSSAPPPPKPSPKKRRPRRTTRQ